MPPLSSESDLLFGVGFWIRESYQKLSTSLIITFDTKGQGTAPAQKHQIEETEIPNFTYLLLLVIVHFPVSLFPSPEVQMF